MTTKIEYSVVFSVIGSFVFYFLGGADTLLKVMVSLILLDYLTGFTKAIMTTGLNSNKGLKGILRKTMYLSAIILSVLLDKVTHLNEAGLSFRTIMLLYMIGTEGISILENLSIMGIKMPKKIENMLESGVIDPLKVQISALENAVSVSTAILNMGGSICLRQIDFEQGKTPLMELR